MTPEILKKISEATPPHPRARRGKNEPFRIEVAQRALAAAFVRKMAPIAVRTGNIELACQCSRASSFATSNVDGLDF